MRITLITAGSFSKCSKPISDGRKYEWCLQMNVSCNSSCYGYRLCRMTVASKQLVRSVVRPQWTSGGHFVADDKGFPLEERVTTLTHRNVSDA